jgi:hypothetical protein
MSIYLREIGAHGGHNDAIAQLQAANSARRHQVGKAHAGDSSKRGF